MTFSSWSKKRQQSMQNRSDLENSDSTWKTLYKLGAASALIAVVFFRRFLGAELMAFDGFGIFNVPETEPASALEWFKLLQEEKFVGLVLLGVVDLINYALVGLIFLALYGALRRANKGAMAIALTFSLVSIVVYFATNQALAMLALSKQYAGATTEVQRSSLLAAGEARLAVNNPVSIYQGTGFYISFFLILLAGLIISIVMLRSNVFSTTTAIFGILANGIALCYFIALAFAPALAWLPPPISAPFRLIWYILIAAQLLKLGRIDNQTGTRSESDFAGENRAATK